jgi:hypothetical protein
MEAKLIKMLEGYIVSLTGDIDDIYAITNKELAEEHGFYSLSIKNCQAIELGYDLDELAILCTKDEDTIVGNQKMAIGFIKGFKKALEILGDKKFSEEDAKRLFELGIEYGHQKGYVGLDYTNDILQSLQQTEWDVIIKTTCDGMVTGLCMPEVCDCNIIPKLDADGCLILKRI